MCRTCYIICNSFLVFGCAHRHSSPDKTFALLVEASKNSDLSAFAEHVSSETIEYLKSCGIENDNAINRKLPFMMDWLASGDPYTIRGQRIEEDTAYLEVERRDTYRPSKIVRSEHKLVREREVWKRDLQDEFQAWDHLREWAREVQRKIKRAAPPIGMRSPLESLDKPASN